MELQTPSPTTKWFSNLDYRRLAPPFARGGARRFILVDENPKTDAVIRKWLKPAITGAETVFVNYLEPRARLGR